MDFVVLDFNDRFRGMMLLSAIRATHVPVKIEGDPVPISMPELARDEAAARRLWECPRN